MVTEETRCRNFHVFGCDALVQIPGEKRRKLDERAEKLTFVGYSDESKAFQFVDKTTNRIKISQDVVFLDQLRDQVSNNSECAEIELALQENKEDFQEIDKEEKRLQNPAQKIVNSLLKKNTAVLIKKISRNPRQSS